MSNEEILNSESDKMAFANYLAQSMIAVCDPTNAAGERLKGILISLGADANKIVLTRTFEDGVKLIKDIKPDVVFSEYNLGSYSAFDLFNEFRIIRDDVDNTLAIMVTSNTSQANVARAAEEDVDAFIIKPYSTDFIKDVLVEVTKVKLNPSQYIKMVKVGRDLLLSGKPQEAMEILSEAKKHNSEPTLALFYLGQAEFLMQALSNAEDNYREGLQYNEIHFKCLTSLYEILLNAGKHEKAYEIIKKLTHFFPANPDRLNKVLRLAVMTQNYVDIESYYDIFVELNLKDEILVKYLSAGLVTLGKYYIGADQPTRAVEVFNKAASIGKGRPIILRNIIESLVDHGLYNECAIFFDMFNEESRSGEDFVICDFLVHAFSEDLETSISKGFKLIEVDLVSNRMVFKVQDLLLRKADRRVEAREIRKRKEKIFGQKDG